MKTTISIYLLLALTLGACGSSDAACDGENCAQEQSSDSSQDEITTAANDVTIYITIADGKEPIEEAEFADPQAAKNYLDEKSL
jgi:major membrane immunogen (membrane-anchored lipoprotein)